MEEVKGWRPEIITTTEAEVTKVSLLHWQTTQLVFGG
jgi:hypothetical protein